MKLTREDVIAYLEGLPAMELSALIVELQRVVGLPEPLRVRAREVNVVSGPEVRSDDGYRTVKLLAVGNNKTEVIKVIRAEKPYYGLLEVKRLVERAPVELTGDLPQGEADDFARKLREAGAEVEVR